MTTTSTDRHNGAAGAESQIDAVAAADAALFSALLGGDLPALERILAEDFLIIDVAGGDVHSRTALFEALESGAVTFTSIQSFPQEAVIRFAGAEIGIVVGRTQMSISGPDGSIEVSSRYTHVFQREDGDWRLLSAQGTRIG